MELYKFMYPPELPRGSLAIIGCVQPLGALFPIAEIQSRWAVRVIKVAFISLVMYRIHMSIILLVFQIISFHIKTTVKIVSKFTSFYRFILLNLSFYRCKLPNKSFFPSIVLSFYRFIVLSFNRFLVKNIEFILSFYRFIAVKKT